jgi:hypothetical protein
VNEVAGEEEVSEGREVWWTSGRRRRGTEEKGSQSPPTIGMGEASRELAREKEGEKEKNDMNEEAGEEEASKWRESLVEKGRGRGARGGTRNSYERGREETRVTLMRRGGKQVEGKFGGCRKGKGEEGQSIGRPWVWETQHKT